MVEYGPVVIESTFNAPVVKVWKAITDKDEMKKWYFDLESFNPIIGFEFQFLAGTDKNKYLHLCKITEMIPHKILSYSWRYDGHEGDSVVSIELSEVGNNTKLKLTHTGLETFPMSNPDFAKENFIIGWTYFIERSLQSFLK